MFGFQGVWCRSPENFRVFDPPEHDFLQTEYLHKRSFIEGPKQLTGGARVWAAGHVPSPAYKLKEALSWPSFSLGAAINAANFD